MNASFYKALVATGVSYLLVSASFAQTPNAPTGKGFDAFPLLRSRNVFDPNRRAPRTEESQARRPGQSRNRTDSFTLTGTMVTEGKTLAFFSGTRAEYSRVIAVGESIGDFKLKTIAAGQVELERDGKATALAIGRTLQLEGTHAPEGPDTPEETVDSNTPPASAGTSPDAASLGSTSPSVAPGAPGGATVPGAPPDKAELMRRMMERRQKEMSK